MFRARSPSTLALVFSSSVLAASVLPSNEITIRLADVPTRLALPLPDGVNLILTAHLGGGEVARVWLAPDGSGEAPDQRGVALRKIDADEYAINVASQEVYDVLAAHGAAGQVRVFAKAADGTIASSLAIRYTLDALPWRLDFPYDRATLTVRQRSSKKLPGSGGGIVFRVGDITAGQVLVMLQGPRGRPLIDTTSMREGDVLTISLADEQYVLRLDDLVNLLVGQDYGVFTLIPRGAWEASKIDGLLRLVEHSEETFIRNDQEMTARQFAEFLRQKREFYAPPGASVAEFIEKVASESTTTGQPYRVKLPSGETIETAKWLREVAGLEKEKGT